MLGPEQWIACLSNRTTEHVKNTRVRSGALDFSKPPVQLVTILPSQLRNAMYAQPVEIRFDPRPNAYEITKFSLGVFKLLNRTIHRHASSANNANSEIAGQASALVIRSRTRVAVTG